MVMLRHWWKLSIKLDTRQLVLRLHAVIMSRKMVVLNG